MKHTKNNILLLLAAFIWGSAFVAQSVGMDYVGPFTFTCVRSIIGALVLLPVIACMDGMNGKNWKVGWQNKNLWIGGICCGVILAVASSLQQIGIQYTSVGKAGFITALYVIFVPIVRVFFGKKPSKLIWGCVALAIVGLYLLCINESVSLNLGDLLVFACTLIFTAHILVIDHFSPLVDGVRMSCIQFATAGILCLVPTVLIEQPAISAITGAWLPILYAGVLSCGVAYTLQIVGQKNADPTMASLLLSLESVFSVLSGWLILGEKLSVKESLGCVLMFAAIVLAQLNPKKQS